MVLCMLYLLLLIVQWGTSSPYGPREGEWLLTLTTSGKELARYNGTDQPIFELDLCSLLGDVDTGLGAGAALRTFMDPAQYHWVPGTSFVGCGWPGYYEANLLATDFYTCPAKASPECGGPEDYYCAKWGCETIAPWANRDVDLEIQRKGERSRRVTRTQTIGNNNPIVIKVKTWQQHFIAGDGWSMGKTWGIRLYMAGRDPGTRFTIQWRPKRASPEGIGPSLDVLGIGI